MGKASELLLGFKVIEEVNSHINGKISVIQSIPFGIYLQVGNLTQSGGVVYQVWKHTLKKLKTPAFAKSPTLQSYGDGAASVGGQNLKVKNCLILGLGGGSAVKLVKKYWPEAEITGVDLDPVMVELGRRYLDLNLMKVKTEISDAYVYCVKAAKEGKKYDLVLVDVYVGDKVPEILESEMFIKLVRQILKEGGVAIFNRLYYDEKKPEAALLLKKLERIFSKVTFVYPEANVMFVCSVSLTKV